MAVAKAPNPKNRKGTTIKIIIIMLLIAVLVALLSFKWGQLTLKPRNNELEKDLASAKKALETATYENTQKQETIEVLQGNIKYFSDEIKKRDQQEQTENFQQENLRQAFRDTTLRLVELRTRAQNQINKDRGDIQRVKDSLEPIINDLRQQMARQTDENKILSADNKALLKQVDSLQQVLSNISGQTAPHSTIEILSLRALSSDISIDPSCEKVPGGDESKARRVAYFEAGIVLNQPAARTEIYDCYIYKVTNNFSSEGGELLGAPLKINIARGQSYCYYLYNDRKLSVSPGVYLLKVKKGDTFLSSQQIITLVR